MNGVIHNNNKDYNNEFCHAVLLAFDQSTQSTPYKQQAIQYCDRIKHSVDGYQICIEQLHYVCIHQLRDEIKFYCLSTLLYHIQQYYTTQYTEQQRNYICSSIMLLIRDVFNVYVQPNFIKNKLCTVLVQLLKYDYLTRWQSFFTDFTSLLNEQSIEIVDIFIRLLRVLDDEIVVVDERRNETEILHNTQIKDSMRINDLQTIVTAIIWIVQIFNNNKSTIVASCLDCLAEYIGWIDIQYTVHQTMLSMLYTCLMNSSTQLQAAHCLCEIVDKRMESAKKVVLIHDIQLIDMLYKIDLETANQKFSRRVAQLISATGEQLCLAIKDLTKSNDSTQMINDAYNMLERVMSIAYTLIQYNRWKSTRTLIDLLTAYLQVTKSKNNTPEIQTQYQRIFQLIVHAVQYPSWYDHDQPDDKEAAYTDYRAQLIKLFILITRYNTTDLICQSLAVEVNKLFNTQTDILTVPFAQLEAVLKLHYTLGEAIQKSTTTRIVDANDILTQMTYRILTSNVSHYNHYVIQIKWYEIVHRYNKIMEHKQDLIIPLMTSFIDTRAIRNTNSSVAARASYLLLRTVLTMNESIKQKLTNIISDMLTSIQTTIQPILTVTDSTTQHTIAGDECNFLCETMGSVTTTAVVGSEECTLYAQTVATYFNTQLQTAIQLANSIQHNTIQYEQLQQCVCCIVEAYACYTKPLTKEGSKLSNIWIQSVHIIITVLQTFHDSESVHCKIITFLHRMIDCIQQLLLPLIPSVLDILLKHTTSNSITMIIQLCGQLVAFYKQQIESVLNTILPVLLQQYFNILQQYSTIDSIQAPVATQSIQNSERITLIRTMLVFLKQVLNVGLYSVLTTTQSMQSLMPAVIQWLLRCASETDSTVSKSAYALFKQLLPYWYKLMQTQQLDSTYYKQLIYHDITVQTFNTLLSTYIDPQLASYDSVIREICELQVQIQSLFGNTYTTYIQQLLSTPPYNVSNDIVNEYIRLFNVQDNGVQLRKFVKQWILSRKTVK